jgi:hypothetical protein
MQNPLYIIIHIHKCAGVSMSKHIIRYVNPHEYLGLYKNTKNPYFENRSMIIAYLKSLSDLEVNSLKVIIGHGAFYGIHNYINRPCRYIVFLREPYARTVSNYAFFLQDTLTGKKHRRSIIGSKGILYSFNEWLSVRTLMHDYMTKFLYHNFFYKNISGEATEGHLQKVVDILNSFYFVGIVEKPIDHLFLYDRLGLPLHAQVQNQTNKKYYPQNLAASEFMQYLTQDSALYSYFLSYPKSALSMTTKIRLSLKYMKNMYL